MLDSPAGMAQARMQKLNADATTAPKSITFAVFTVGREEKQKAMPNATPMGIASGNACGTSVDRGVPSPDRVIEEAQEA